MKQVTVNFQEDKLYYEYIGVALALSEVHVIHASIIHHNVIRYCQ